MEQQPTNDGAIRDNVIQLLNILKQRSLGNKIDDVEASKLINNIISTSKDDLAKLHRSKRGLMKEVKKGYRWLRGSIQRLNTQENRELLIKEGPPLLHKSVHQPDTSEDWVEKILDFLDVFDPFRDLGKSLDYYFERDEESLCLAAKQGRLDRVKYLIEYGVNVNARGDNGYTPLHAAAYGGYLDVIKYLIEKGADVNADNNGYTPLHTAANTDHLDVVKYLIDRGADVNAKSDSGRTPLHNASISLSGGSLGIVKYLIEKGANPNAIDGDGKTPLQRANEKGISDIVEYLAERMPQITEVPHTTERQQTTEVPQVTERQQATERQQVTTEISQTTEEQQVTGDIPLDGGSGSGDVDIEDYSNISLHFAAEQGNLNAVKYFVEQGADVNANNWHAGTPLHLAVWNGHLDVVKYLIANGASVNLKDSRRNEKGWAPLHDAAHRGYLDIVKCLVEKGADINAQDNYDSITPLHEAALYGHLAVVEELIEKKANINIKNKRGYTPLHSAALNGYLTVVEKLIEKGADINAKNAYGETPLDIARSRGNSQVVEFLSSYQHGNRDRRDVVSGNSWTNNSIVNWVKGLTSPTESPALLTSREQNNHTVTAIPEINKTKSGNIQTGSKKSEKTSSATLLNVSHSGKSPVQGISKENVSNKGWSSSRRKVEGSTNFGAALPKGASSTASSISQVYAQPDITGLMLLVPTFMNTMGRKFVLPLLSADQPISPEKAHAYASNITNGFKEVLEQQAALKNGIGVHRFKIDFMKMQEEITGKIIGGKFNEISGILKSYAEKACPSREAGCSGRLSQKKFDKFIAEFNRRIDPAINQLMQKMLSKSEVSDVKEQQISLKPKSYLNGTSVQGHLTQDRDLKNQGKVLIP